jgi:hypothetical protein
MVCKKGENYVICSKIMYILLLVFIRYKTKSVSTYVHWALYSDRETKHRILFEIPWI